MSQLTTLNIKVGNVKWGPNHNLPDHRAGRTIEDVICTPEVILQVIATADVNRQAGFSGTLGYSWVVRSL